MQKIASPTERIKSLSVLKSKLFELGGKEIWANIDLPTEIRAPEIFVTGLKKVLLSPEWGFGRGSVRAEIDGPSKHLKVEGKVVLTASCTDGGLVCEWEETWKNWGELHGDPEIKALTDKATKIISGAAKGKGK